jgi:hypothetical protein
LKGSPSNLEMWTDDTHSARPMLLTGRVFLVAPE